MNWQHLQAFVWLRWRLLVNQARRSGKFNAIVTVIVCVAALVSVVPLFLSSFAFAVFAIPRAQPAHLMYAWDGLVLAFLFFWMIGLITDLQRNDPLALSKFMHLPVSVHGAFLLNYLSSLLRLSLLFFGPVMLAYALALLYVRGVEQWSAIPLLAAFLLMVTGLTYQFQGWLALLMNNPRRRRAVVVATTMGVVLLAQAPNLINIYAPWNSRRNPGMSAAQKAEFDELVQAIHDRRVEVERLADQVEEARRRAAGDEELAGLRQAARDRQADLEQLAGRLEEVKGRTADEAGRARREKWAHVEHLARVGNMAIPIGWLPFGVQAAAEGRVAPALFGLAGLTLIGAASLGRAYRTTVAAYRGQASNRTGSRPAARPTADATADATAGRRAGTSLLEARLTGVSEPVAVIALGGFRSLLRSPEAKIALLSPLILAAVFGSMLFQRSGDMPALTRPLLGIGAMVSVLFGLLPLMGNQFGIDRDGFRVFVLSAAARRDILLGKNLTYAPVAFAFSAVLLVLVQVLLPMRLDHALAMIPQFVSMFLLFCIMANMFSIYAPMHNAVGTLKPANPKLTTVLLQLVLFLLLFPLSQGLTLIPLGTEAGLHALGWGAGLPICLVLAVIECIAVVFLYRATLGWLGDELQAREQRILEVVTNRAA